ncbi:MAG: carboxypeptidase regulatory-like domain-containing protein, partial [Bacteroidota bacterium]
PDLVAGCDDGRVYLHPNLGKQSFTKAKSLRSGAANWGLGLADFNQDGKLDIASASYLDKKLCIHLGQGGLSFAREQVVLSGDHNFDLVIGDFDLDGDLDIVTCSTVDRSMGFHLNDGKGVMGPRNEMGSGNWNAAVAAGDFDLDGDEDIVTASINDHMINVHRNISIEPEDIARKSQCVFGKVYNGDTKEILPNVPISLQNAEGKSIETQYTDEEGGYRFCPTPNRSYQLVVRAPGLPVHVEGFDMPESDLEKDIYIVKPTAAFVFGKIRDENSYQPLAGASIYLYDNQGELVDSLRSDKRGNYRRELAFGHYSVRTEKIGYYPKETDFTLEERHVEKGLRHNIELKAEKAPEGICVVGIVRDIQTELPVPHAQILIRNEIGLAERQIEADAEGNYRVCLQFGEYEFSTTAKGYFFHLSDVELTDSMYQDGKDHTHDIWLDPLIEGAKIVLENIYYDVDKATLRDESIEELNRLLKVMEDNPDLVVEISGHTDSDGSDEHNETLSQNRAQSVVSFLQKAGVYDQRMVAKGYGEHSPIAPNDNATNKQLNRRTEFKVLKIEEEGR